MKIYMNKNNSDQIIRALKNFDIEALSHLLDDDKSYMNVSKKRFLRALNKAFHSARQNGSHAFDDVFFGICGHCNKGCEGRTFFSNTGHFLDLFIEAKDGTSVDDIYICNNLTNFTNLEKRYDLSFRFYKDDEVKFIPDQEYLRLRHQFNSMKSEFELLKDGISLDDLVEWYAEFDYLRSHINNLDFLDRFEYKLYKRADALVYDLDSIIIIKNRAQHAVEALIDIQMATSEKEQVIWFFENEEDHYSSSDINSSINSNLLTFQSHKRELIINISGYEYVLDYFHKVDDVHDALMEKYQPLPEHYKHSGTRIEYSLESYLRLHHKYLDVLDQYKS